LSQISLDTFRLYAIDDNEDAGKRKNVDATVDALLLTVAIQRGHCIVFRRLLDFVRDQAGAVLVEFTVIAPLLLTLWLAAIEFGFILSNNVTLTTATNAGAYKLSTDRGVSSTPLTDTVNQIKAAAGTLTTANITTTVAICTSATTCTACSTDATCLTQLTSAQGQAATVSTSYPCVFAYTMLNLGSSCQLTSAMTYIVQ
jgi:Flp pilus assembly protein TadG